MNERLGSLLIEQGLIEEKQLDELLEIQQKNPIRLGQLIVKRGILTEEKLMNVLAKRYGYRYHKHLHFHYDEIFTRIPLAFIHKTNMVPIQKTAKTITVAIIHPEEVHYMDDFQMFLEPYRVEFILSGETEILRIIHGKFDQAVAAADEVISGMDKEEYSEFEHISENTLDMANEAPIIRMVNAVMTQAVQERASDIHIEPGTKSLDVRYRIDGILHLRLQPPRIAHAGLVSRIKIMANLNIAENRLPQDGRIKIKLTGKDIDIRVSTIPTQYGERIVMRILNKSDTVYNLESLQIYPHLSQQLQKIIHEPNGIFLVTGPTGSGKSTTLYAALSSLNDGIKNILTAEDPVEYEIEGVGQMQVQDKIGLGFAQALRAMLRQDPDIIMVGEIRDEETARIAIQSSLTGHFVFSTLHTNDAPSAITRLIDMGIEPYLITSTVRAVLAQRLVRRICSECKKSYSPRTEEIQNLGMAIKNLRGKKLYYGKGCNVCLGTGYLGRTGIYSLMHLTPAVHTAILHGEDATNIGKKASSDPKLPMNSLLEYSFQKALDGITTLEEIMRVT